MKREFKIENGKRYVKIKSNKLHIYHPECAPENSIDSWSITRNSCCAKCLKPIYKQ